jgi:hypothetical protein
MSVATLLSPPAQIRHPFKRALIAGCAWGLPMAALLIAMSALACGGICLTDAALTTAISVITGVVAMGPIAAFPRPPRA